MTVHLLKLAVGVESLVHLRDVQKDRRGERNGCPIVAGFTRRRPRREAELVNGGSIYWVIKGAICARQRIVGLEEAVDRQGDSFCRLLLDPDLAATVPIPKRAFQGWRYLAPEDAPSDLDGDAAAEAVDALPPDMARELRDLGLI